MPVAVATISYQRFVLGERLVERSVLVTGADGFIGSHLVEHLVRKGLRVRAFVLYNSFNSWGWLDHCSDDVKSVVEAFPGDVRDPFAVREAMRGIDVVYHLASLIAIPYSYHAPASYVETNINGTLNILQAARDESVSKLVHTSTSEVYGTARFVPMTEEHPLTGQSPYSASKIGADQMAMAFHSSFGLPVAIARPFNTYGPRQSARAIVPTIVSQIAAGQSELKLGDRRPTRDFNFVTDTVRGFVAIGESRDTVGQVVNLGTGCEVSIGALVELIVEVMGANVTIVQDEQRLRPADSEVFRLCACAQRAKELTGWEPEYAGMEGLRRGIDETVTWFCDSDNLSKYKTGAYNV